MSIRTGTQSGTLSVSSLINQGLISAETSGKLLTISSPTFTNSGTAQATDGTLSITSTSWTNTGTLGVSGNGILQLGGNFTTAGLGTISRAGHGAGLCYAGGVRGYATKTAIQIAFRKEYHPQSL